MPLDLNKSYDDINNKIESFNTFKKSKSDVKNRLQQKTNFDVSSLSSAAKGEAKNQLDNLINTFTNTNSSGSATITYLLGKFVRSVKLLRPQIKEIIVSCMIKSLGCDLEQTYDGGQVVYIKVSSIDIFGILKKDPNTDKYALALYEKQQFTNSSVNAIPRSTNRMLNELLQNQNTPYSDIYNTNGVGYKGFSDQELFDIEYVNQRPSPINPNALEFGDFYKITLKNREGDINRVVDFFQDYYQTVELIDFNTLFKFSIDIMLSDLFSVQLGNKTKTLDDSTKFGRFIQRIFGECFDNDSEISVSGNAKTPVLDDTSDRFFELTAEEEIDIQAKVSNALNGIVIFEDCDNVQLPVAEEQADYMYKLIEKISENNVENYFTDEFFNTLANDPKWSKDINLPKLKLSFNFKMLRMFPLAVVFSVLSPKILLPYFTMLKALGIPYSEDVDGKVAFLREFRSLVNCITSKIFAIFTKLMYDLIKKDLKNLARAIISDISGDQTGSIYLVIEKLVSVVLFASALVRDYRSCKNIIDSILALLNLVKVGRLQLIPPPLLLLSEFLPGASPNRAFINHIQNLQKMGLPTNPLPDGSPNLGLMANFSIFQSYYNETTTNGKVEGAFSYQQIAPTGAMPAYIKVTGKYL